MLINNRNDNGLFDLIIKEYHKMTDFQKAHRMDFEILDSIYSSGDFDIEETRNLFNVIKDVWLRDDENTSLSYIADKISQAYYEKNVSMETLLKTDNHKILECVLDLDNFEDLEDEIETENEY